MNAIPSAYTDFVWGLAKPNEKMLAHFTGQPRHLGLWHMAPALLGECVEYAIHDPKDVPGILKELGDILFYTAWLQEYFRPANKARIKPPAKKIGLLPNAEHVFTIAKRICIYEQKMLPLELAGARQALSAILEEIKMEARQYGSTLEKVMELNVAKLHKRYGTAAKYSDSAAQQRADEA